MSQNKHWKSTSTTLSARATALDAAAAGADAGDAADIACYLERRKVIKQIPGCT